MHSGPFAGFAASATPKVHERLHWCRARFRRPLAALEEWLEVRGNVQAYRGPFLLHYLDAVVYPDIPPNLLFAGAVAICILKLWIYARRLHARHSLG